MIQWTNLLKDRYIAKSKHCQSVIPIHVVCPEASRILSKVKPTDNQDLLPAYSSFKLFKSCLDCFFNTTHKQHPMQTLSFIPSQTISVYKWRFLLPSLNVISSTLVSWRVRSVIALWTIKRFSSGFSGEGELRRLIF